MNAIDQQTIIKLNRYYCVLNPAEKTYYHATSLDQPEPPRNVTFLPSEALNSTITLYQIDNIYDIK